MAGNITAYETLFPVRAMSHNEILAYISGEVIELLTRHEAGWWIDKHYFKCPKVGYEPHVDPAASNRVCPCCIARWTVTGNTCELCGTVWRLSVVSKVMLECVRAYGRNLPRCRRERSWQHQWQQSPWGDHEWYSSQDLSDRNARHDWAYEQIRLRNSRNQDPDWGWSWSSSSWHVAWTRHGYEPHVPPAEVEAVEYHRWVCTSSDGTPIYALQEHGGLQMPDASTRRGRFLGGPGRSAKAGSKDASTQTECLRLKAKRAKAKRL